MTKIIIIISQSTFNGLPFGIVKLEKKDRKGSLLQWKSLFDIPCSLIFLCLLVLIDNMTTSLFIVLQFQGNVIVGVV